MMGSAVERMQLYVGYFGLTTERFFALAFMGWLGVVLVWLALTVLRDWGAPFLGGSVLAGLAGLVALNVADPSAIIARTNLRRPMVVADRTSPREVDLAYLARLDDGAVPLVVQALLDTAATSGLGGIGRRVAVRSLPGGVPPPRGVRAGGVATMERGRSAARQLGAATLAGPGCHCPELPETEARSKELRRRSRSTTARRYKSIVHGRYPDRNGSFSTSQYSTSWRATSVKCAKFTGFRMKLLAPRS